MKIETLSRRAKEAMAVSGIYQRLGVDSDDIYFQPVMKAEGEWYPAVVAVLPSGKIPAWMIPIYGAAKTQDELLAEWETAAVLWNTLPNKERIRWVNESEAQLVAMDFLSYCASTGIFFETRPPASPGRKLD